ncbi:MAG: methyl-accepting chemotaxis protein [Oscillospiraceae bacterium]|nr:methyl-accepting chemotaxis protein [Oscillospiraceae bacterium]
MKNLKVSVKLIISFMIVVMMTIGLGVFSLICIKSINSSYNNSYESMAVPMPYMSKILDNMQEMRVCAREYALGALHEDSERIERARQVADSNKAENEKHLDAYFATIVSDEAKNTFAESRTLYENEYLDFIRQAYSWAKDGDVEKVDEGLIHIAPTMNKIIEGFETCLNMKVESGAQTSEANTKLTETLNLLIIVVLIIVVAVAVFLAFYISNLISKPLIPLTKFMNRAGTTGNIALLPEDVNTIQTYSTLKDETGVCIAATASFLEHVSFVSAELERVARGDLSSEIKPLSDKDTIGVSLQKTLRNLNDMFSQIQSSTALVTSGSRQISAGAQALAQGSTQQAAAVQELSSSVFEIAQKTKENAEKAAQTAKMSNTIKINAEKGSNRMDEMIAAVNEINQASQSISKVIKVIDDIAFQTNILALNAAVEAARAGDAGKGFAVVAEEVRNLAAKSAQAAKETGTLIMNSGEKAQLGSRIAHETAESLAEIVSGINESVHYVEEIAQSGEEQSTSIAQVNLGIDQVAQVIQTNSATAEESAAASEELSSLARVLEDLVKNFKLN